MDLARLARLAIKAFAVTAAGAVIWFTVLVPALIGWAYILGFLFSPKGM